MSESDLEFVERMKVRGAWAPDSDMARLFSLARRGAETLWRPIEEAARVVMEHYQELSAEHRLLLVNRAAAIRALIPSESETGERG